ncbi:unnamed protein product [Pseudo-nitzschia multistriata]|uniref:Uncharacterized protein n=1 Tax=Pseudo-nitzschia multistriata TaxID=183589 RepID=A0A448YUB7_9STRA|nr:unnamed protein product [Pseudo-nitzschia multistriata]
MKRPKRSSRAELTVSPKKAKKTVGDKAHSIADLLLSTMVQMQVKRNKSCTSYTSIMKARKMNDRNTPWRKEWRSLIEEGFIQPASVSKPATSNSDGGGNGIFTGNYELTEKGEDRAGTPEMKAIKNMIETEAETSEEQHARIRKICMNNRTVQIFDLLLKHGPLTRKELAATIGISDRGAPFSYGLRQLKELGYVVVDAKNSGRGSKALILSDKAFVDPKDRPREIHIDPQILAANLEKVYGREKRAAAAAKSSSLSIKEEKVKEESNPAIKNEEGTPSPVQKEDDSND